MRVTAAPAGSHEPARGLAEEPLNQLVGATCLSVVHIGLKGIEPHVKASAHVTKCFDRNENCGDEHGETDDQPRDSIRCDVEGCNEKPEEEKRGSQIALEDKNCHTDKPDDQDRTQVARAWKT